ncbi:seven-hairpin glycosidase [Obba rivulosa]|uniref:alpha-1,2-Mannosidase n=1 Tax=Obba rivulosa TaxID=1052685 RepID=A0A8E2ATQ7_9APHY|nr:seven-hairpin glycosidase [Obba rivulosa]
MASHIPLHKRTLRLLPFALGAGFLFWSLVYFAWPHLDPSRLLPPPHRPPLPHFAPVPPHFQPGPPPDPKWTPRADAVREAFLHAYRGYLEHAYPDDELLPLTDGSVNNFNGWSLTLVDGLDTMWIMGLHDEFYDTIPTFANMTFALPEKSFAAFFETVIRHLGGMLSAYALSGDPILLARADDLGSKLLPAFHTGSGFPKYAVNTVTGEIRPGWTGSAVLWAEALSCQLEYKYLAHLTGRRQYFDTVEKAMDIVRNADVTDGQFPTKWHVETGKPINQHFSVGAFADSAHEYLLKQWLLTAGSEQKALDLYMRASSSILKELLFLTPNRNLLYVTDTTGGRPSHTFEHLSCFLPGLLALGAHTLPLAERERELHLWAAEGLAYTCWVTYADQASGLGPDEVVMHAIPRSAENPRAGRWLAHVEKWEEMGRPGDVPPGLREVPPKGKGQRDYTPRKNGYHLRPEAVESFYILWRTTGDEKWRERGWAVFEAIERETKTRSGYAGVIDVDQSPAPKKNEMPSFFMAETLKYLYLLFSDRDIVPLDQWVFNTEAHPLPIFEWSDQEKKQYGI